MQLQMKTTCDGTESPAIKKIIHFFHVCIIFESSRIYKYKKCYTFYKEFLFYNQYPIYYNINQNYKSIKLLK